MNSVTCLQLCWFWLFFQFSDILAKINAQIKEKTHSRLFAVIQFCENQFKITAEDIISVGSFFPAKVGDKIRLEKVGVATYFLINILKASCE